MPSSLLQVVHSLTIFGLKHAVCSIIDMTKHSIYLSLYIVGEREKERAVNDSIEMGEEHPLKDAEV
jgi:hypothetical protein